MTALGIAAAVIDAVFLAAAVWSLIDEIRERDAHRHPSRGEPL